MSAAESLGDTPPQTAEAEEVWHDPAGWFADLGIPPNSPQADITRALRRKMLALHPDKAALRGDGEEAAATATAQMEKWRAIQKTLQNEGLRATYHLRGAEAALSGVSTGDGSAQLNRTMEWVVPLHQLVHGGDAQFPVQRKVDGRPQQRRVHLSWSSGHAHGGCVMLPKMGHEANLRHPVSGKVVRKCGVARVKVHAQPVLLPRKQGSVVAEGGALVWTAPASIMRFVAQSPMALQCPVRVSAGEEHAPTVYVVPAPRKTFTRHMRVRGMGITQDSDLLIRCVGHDHALEEVSKSIVPLEVAQGLCAANGWPAPVVDAALVTATCTGWADLADGESVFAEPITQEELEASIKEANAAVDRSNAELSQGMQTYSIQVVAKRGKREAGGSVTALSAHVSGEAVREAETVSACAQQ